MAWTAVGTWGAAACANTLNQVRARVDGRRGRHEPQRVRVRAPQRATSSPWWRPVRFLPTLRAQVAEVRNDALMKRTHRRPLPSGALSCGHALAFALLTGVGGVALLYTQARARARRWRCLPEATFCAAAAAARVLTRRCPAATLLRSPAPALPRPTPLPLRWALATSCSTPPCTRR
jgi:hypothetical protein